MFIYIVIGFVAVLIVAIIILSILMVVKPDIFSKKNSVNFSGNNSQNSISGQFVGDSKDFNPVKNFEDFAMDLGNHNYRAVIEVSSVNYGLLSGIEQNTVEQSYQNFLNSLSFPVEIYIQTREFDTGMMMQTLHEQSKKAIKKFPSVSGYASEYELNMSHLTEYIQNSKIKKKYIIIPYNNTDLADVSELNNFEIRSFAIEELLNRCGIVMQGINGIGLNGSLLNKSEIAEVIYSYYHRDSYRIAGDIVGGEYDSLVVNGNMSKDFTKRSTLDDILNSCKNRIKNELITSDCTAEELGYFRYICSFLDFFKQNDRNSYIGDLMRDTIDVAEKNGYINEYYNFAEKNADIISETNFDDEEDKEEINPHYYEDKSGVFPSEKDYNPNYVGDNESYSLNEAQNNTQNDTQGGYYYNTPTQYSENNGYNTETYDNAEGDTAILTSNDVRRDM